MRCRRQKDQDIASFACSRNACDRSLHWHDRTTRRRSTRAIDRVRWNMKHFRQTARAVAWSHSAAHCMHCIWLGRTKDNAWTGHDRSQCTIEQGPVMTGHNNARSSKDRSRKKAVMAAMWSFLLDRLDVERSILRFPSLLHASEGCSPNTGERKLKNRKFFVGW